MVQALDPRDTIEIVLKDDAELPEEEQTVWLFKPLTLAAETAIADEASDLEGNKIRVKNGSVELWTLRAGLIGVRNWKDSAGNPVELEMVPGTGFLGGKKMVSDRSLGRISLRHRHELVDSFQNRNRLTEDDAEK